MVDYYPVISRAVARLENSNYLTRRALYDRARAALVAQLTKANSGVGEAQLQHERRALEDAIDKTETEAGRTAIAASIQGARLNGDDIGAARAPDALAGASATPTVANRSAESPSNQAAPLATAAAEIANRSDAQKPTDAKAAAKPLAPDPDAADWYLAKTADGSVRQVVISVPPGETVATKFGAIFLKYDRFPMLASGTWCAGFFRLDNHPGPYLMLRLDDFVEAAKEAPLAVAFSFCKTSAGALFVISARVGSEAVGTAVRGKFPQFPPLKYPVAEWITSLNSKYDVDLIGDALSRERIHMVLARNSDSRMTVFSDSGAMNLTPPQAVCDIVVPLDPAIASRLRAEWNALLAQHHSIPNSKLDFNQAQRELVRALPLDKDPVLPRPALPERPERAREPPLPLRNTGAATVETPADQDYFGPSGIEGWLMLFAIGLVVSPLLLLIEMAITFPPILSKLGQLNQSLATFIVLEFSTSIAMLAGTLYVAYLFFNKKRKTPAWVIGLMAAALFVQLTDAAVTSGVFGGAGDASGMVRSLFACIVWIPYWLVSERVKNTFVRD